MEFENNSAPAPNYYAAFSNCCFENLNHPVAVREKHNGS